ADPSPGLQARCPRAPAPAGSWSSGPTPPAAFHLASRSQLAARTRDADDLAHPEVVGVGDEGVGLQDGVHGGVEPVGQAEEGIPGTDGVEGSPGALGSGRLGGDADLLPDPQRVGIDPRIRVNQLIDGHTKALGQGEEGVAGADGGQEPALAARGSHAGDADLLADPERVGIHPWVGGDQLVDGHAEPLGQGEEGVALPDGVEGPALAGRGGHTRDADLLADLEAIGIHPWVGGDQLVDGDAEPLGQAEEGIARPDGVEGPALAGRGGYTRDADALADLEAIGIGDLGIGPDQGVQRDVKPLSNAEQGVPRPDGVELPAGTGGDLLGAKPCGQPFLHPAGLAQVCHVDHPLEDNVHPAGTGPGIEPVPTADAILRSPRSGGTGTGAPCTSGTPSSPSPGAPLPVPWPGRAILGPEAQPIPGPASPVWARELVWRARMERGAGWLFPALVLHGRVSRWKVAPGPLGTFLGEGVYGPVGAPRLLARTLGARGWACRPEECMWCGCGSPTGAISPCLRPACGFPPGSTRTPARRSGPSPPAWAGTWPAVRPGTGMSTTCGPRPRWWARTSGRRPRVRRSASWPRAWRPASPAPSALPGSAPVTAAAPATWSAGGPRGAGWPPTRRLRGSIRSSGRCVGRTPARGRT